MVLIKIRAHTNDFLCIQFTRKLFEDFFWRNVVIIFPCVRFACSITEQKRSWWQEEMELSPFLRSPCSGCAPWLFPEAACQEPGQGVGGRNRFSLCREALETSLHTHRVLGQFSGLVLAARSQCLLGQKCEEPTSLLTDRTANWFSSWGVFSNICVLEKARLKNLRCWCASFMVYRPADFSGCILGGKERCPCFSLSPRSLVASSDFHARATSHQAAGVPHPGRK